MNRRFWFATLAAFVVAFVLCIVFHGLILARDYAALTAIYRAPAFDALLFALLVLGWLVMAAAMTGLYQFGVEAKPYLGQGVRFGLLAAGVSAVPYNLFWYAFAKLPGALTIKQLILEAIIVVAMGMVIAWFYRK